MKFTNFFWELKYKRYKLYTNLSKEEFVKKFHNCMREKYPQGYVYKRKLNEEEDIELVRIVETQVLRNDILGGIVDSGKYPFNPPLRDINTGEQKDNNKEENTIEPKRSYFVLRTEYINDSPISGTVLSFNTKEVIRKIFPKMLSKCPEIFESLYFVDKEEGIKFIKDEFSLCYSEEEKEEFFRDFRPTLSPLIDEQQLERVLRARTVKKISLSGYLPQNPFTALLWQESRVEFGGKIEISLKETWRFNSIDTLKNLIALAKGENVKNLKVEIEEDEDGRVVLLALDLLNIKDVVKIPVKRNSITGLYNDEEVFNHVLRAMGW